MKKLLLILSMWSICGAVDVKPVTSTTASTYTNFNQRVAEVGATSYAPFYNNSILPVSGKLQVPATFKGTMIGNSKFTSANNSSTDTIEFLGNWNFPNNQVFGDSLTVLFSSGAVSEVRPEWWGNTPTGGIQEALNSLNGAGTVRLSKQYNTTATIYMNQNGQHLIGTGNRKAIINYNPVSGAGTAIEIRKGADVIYDVSVKDVRIITTRNTGKKTAIDAMDFSLFKIDRLSIQYFKGSQSVGIRLRGREASTIEGVFVDADIPIQISKNPNPFDTANPDETIDAQEFTFRDTYLISSDSTQACVLLDTNLATYGIYFDGHNAWVGGKHGFYWHNTRNVASFPIVLRNIWREQTRDSTGYVIYINNAGTSNFFNVELDNIKGGDTDPTKPQAGSNGCNGIYLRGMSNVTLKNVLISNTNKVALDADSTVISMNLDQVSLPTTSTANLAGQRLVASFNKSSSAAPVPNTAWYIAQTQNIANFGQSKTTQQTFVSEPVSQFIGLRNQKIIDILSSTDSTKIAVGASSTGARLYTYSTHPLILGSNNTDWFTLSTTGLLSGTRAQLGYQGIGVTPDSNRLFYIKNLTFNNPGFDKYGMLMQLSKTTGASTYQDDFFGQQKDIKMQQNGEIGTFGGDYTSLQQDSGTVGAVGNTKNAWVIKNDLDLNLGTITGSGNVAELMVDQSSGHTITGKSNVISLTSSWLGTTTDTTSMIRMTNGSGTDYSIIQTGQGKVKFSDTTTSTSSGTGALVVAGGVGVAKKVYAGADSTGGVVLVDKDGVKWRIKVGTTGTLTAVAD